MALSIFVCAALAAHIGAPPAVHDSAAVCSLIDEEKIRAHVEILASDDFEGRRPGTSGGTKAADYIERSLIAAGAEPGLPGATFRQYVPLHQSQPLPETKLDLWVSESRIPLKLGEDYLLHSWGPASTIPRRARLVFVGHGIVAPEFDHNDYANVDVAGTIVVYLSGMPHSLDSTQAAIFAAPEAKRRIAQSRGAIASILIPRVSGNTNVAWSGLRRIFAFPGIELPQGLPDFPGFVFHPERAADLFDNALFDFQQILDMERHATLRAFPLPVSLSFHGRFNNTDFRSPNIVGLIPGGDAELQREVVVVSAHYDHFGISPETLDDRIYNGAVDNAMGVAGLLEIARVISSLPQKPRRSILLLATTAEEEGLLGARYFLMHPPRPTINMVANVNIDGLAFLDAFNDVIAIGAEFSDLDQWLKRAVAPLGLRHGTAPAELWLQDGFARSDQLAFAEAGVPAIMVSEGFDWLAHTQEQAVDLSLRWLHTRYHTPHDDLNQKLDFNAARRHLEAILALVLALADSTTQPQWAPGTHYAYQRALAQARRR